MDNTTVNPPIQPPPSAPRFPPRTPVPRIPESCMGFEPKEFYRKKRGRPPKGAKYGSLSAVERAGVEPEVTLQRLQGWAAHEAIAAAVYICLRHPDSPGSGILEGANTPGDSDSIATLAGALLGARCGIENIPASWVREVERSEVILALADEVSGSLESKG